MSRLSEFNTTKRDMVESNLPSSTANLESRIEDRTSSREASKTRLPVTRQTPKSRYSAEKEVMRLYIPINRIKTIWDIALRSSQIGWSFQIRTYNVRPYNSDVFMMASIGDVNGLQSLFQRGLASPFDVDQLDFGILYVRIVVAKYQNVPSSLRYNHYLVCRCWHSGTNLSILS